jgi:hypothetical protein
MRAVWLVGLGVVACAKDNKSRDGGGLEFEVAGIHLRVGSGTWREESGGAVLGLYLTDQPDACLAVTQVPVGMSTVLTLRVAGEGEAVVLQRTGDPAAGEGTGVLRSATGATETAKVIAVDGTVSWRRNVDGTTTILSMDLGFADTDERIAATMLTMPRCR